MGSSSGRNWQCDKSVGECLEYMYTSGTAADVVFQVGEPRERLQCHKFILISRSPVFFTMFEGHMAEKGEIIVSDIEMEVFDAFLRYLYTDNIHLTIHNATAVLYAARKYWVDRLAKICTAFLQENISINNAGFFLEEAHFFQDDELKDKCLHMIATNQLEFLRDDNFLQLCSSCVSAITSSDELYVDEEVVFDAIMRWSEAKCERENIPNTDDNKRIVLGDVLYTVRFPLMDPDYFVKEVQKCSILSTEEILAVSTCHNNTDIPGNNFKFNTERRAIQRVYRFRKKTLGWNHYTGAPDAISFASAEPMFLHGVGIYGSCEGRTNYLVSIQVYDNNDKLALCSKHQMDTRNLDKDHIFNIMFAERLKIPAEMKYTIISAMKGPRAYNGEEGKVRLVTSDGLIINLFNRRDKSINSSDTSRGQIPCLLVSKVSKYTN